MMLKPAQTMFAGDPLGQWRDAPEAWEKKTLWDLAEYINGRAFKPDDFTTVGLLVIKITELKDGINSSTKRYNGVCEDKHLLRTGDLLFAWSGNPETSLDVFRWRGDQAILNQHIFRVLPRADIDKEYLFFLFKFLRPTFIRTARDKATSMGHVKISDLKRLFAKVPPMDHQKRISRVLYNLDFKIELNQEMNKTLEALGQAVFKRWFIEFEFPNEEGKPYKSSGGEMVHNVELGKNIPKGWAPDRLGNHSTIKGRIGWKGLQVSEYVDEGPYIVGGEQLINSGVNWNNCSRVPQERYDESPEIMLKESDILMTKDGTIGKLAFVDELVEPASVASGIFVIRSNSPIINQMYLWNYLKSDTFRSLVDTRIEGSVVPHLYQRDITDLRIIIPTSAVASQFENVARLIRQKMAANSKCSLTLGRIRDSLLPKLLSGKVRVPVEVR